ncbi:MAG: hypothetical protein JWN99_3204 [Ilumatobacteraceae bacterium]|nr:hypothetical protein [Ilumatobacteraceae bacterium]
MFITAFPLLAATLTRDPLLIAGVTMASRLPWLCFSMITGAVADRMDRRRLMIGADLVRLVIVGALGLAVAFDAANIWMLYGCAFLLGTAETLHVNAAQAIIPALVQPDDLMEANARFSSAQVASAQFAGPPLGAALFNAASSIPFLADAVSFAGSAALVASVPDEHGVDPPTTRLRDDVREGLRFMRHHEALRRLAAVLAIINFFYFSATALLVLYNTQQLHGGTFVYAALFVGAASGTVISRWFVMRMSRRLGFAKTLTISFWMWALTLLGLSAATVPAVAIALFVLLGFGNGLWLVLNTTLRQRLTPDRLLGRMNAAYRTISWGVVPFGAAFGGLFAKLFGLRAPFITAGVVLLLIAVFARRVLQPISAAEGAARLVA